LTASLHIRRDRAVAGSGSNRGETVAGGIAALLRPVGDNSRTGFAGGTRRAC